MKYKIKRKLSDQSLTTWIGKGGVSQELLEEIEEQLEKNKMVKIRILKMPCEAIKPNKLPSKLPNKQNRH